MKVDVLIMMGLPASGKTTLSKAMTEPHGLYDPKFVFSYNAEIEQAKRDKTLRTTGITKIQQQVQTEYLHECYERSIDKEEGRPDPTSIIIVDNNNLSMAEISYYVKVAQACDLTVHVQCISSCADDLKRLHEKSGRGLNDLRRKLSALQNTVNCWPRNFPKIHMEASSSLPAFSERNIVYSSASLQSTVNSVAQPKTVA